MPYTGRPRHERDGQRNAGAQRHRAQQPYHRPCLEQERDQGQRGQRHGAADNPGVVAVALVPFEEREVGLLASEVSREQDTDVPGGIEAGINGVRPENQKGGKHDDGAPEQQT